MIGPHTLLVGVDDTDVEGAEIGTGKLVRMLAGVLPEGARLDGVVRHQLLKVPEIAYTSNNSPACAVIEVADRGLLGSIPDIVRSHVRALASEGSDPGICIATVADVDRRVVDFGIDCCRRVVTQQDARSAAGNLLLEGLGGSNDGIIGALAAVGLTVHGWVGRFIEVAALKAAPKECSVGALEGLGLRLVILERDAQPALPEDIVVVESGFRPILAAGQPALLIRQSGPGRWETLPWTKRNKPHH